MLKFAILGYPIGHSISPQIHKAGFESLGIEADYEILETAPENLVDRIRDLKINDYAGVNVTIPLKVKIAIFVDEVDPNADLAGAINTIKIGADKTLSGYNTDIIGFKSPLPPSLDGKEVTILGTGGASRAVTVACTQLGVKKVNFYTRNIPNALDFVKFFRELAPQIEFTLNQIETLKDLSTTDLLVNTTPIGMKGHSADQSPVDKKVLETLSKTATVYDIVYNPTETVLLEDAHHLGLKTISGLDMLVAQAVAAQKIWFGRTPDFEKMKLAGERALSNYKIDYI
ncbi:MAG: shikimate dehydrogenase [Fusobacterium sp.]|nr:shikimate dehydrogenase [Fusobacterium sp.]